MNRLGKIIGKFAVAKYTPPIFIFLFAIVIRLIYTATFKNAWMQYGFPESDARSMDIVAMNILKGRGMADYLHFFSYYSYRGPLYSIFLSMIYGFFGHNYFVARIFQVFISSATTVIVYFIALKALNSKKAAFISGIITALYIHFIYYAHSLMTETLFIFFMTLSVLLLLSGVQKRSWKMCAWAGVITAATILTREAFLSGTPILVLWIVIMLRQNKKIMAGLAAVFCAALLLTLSPWVIRNYSIHGKPILGSAGMRNLWNGADPKHMGDFYSKKAWRESLWINPYATESERLDYELPKALEYIKRYPSLFLSFCKTRFAYYWKLPKNPLSELDLGVKPLTVLLRILRSFTNFIMPFGILGFLISIRRWRAAVLLGGIIVIYSAFHGAFGGTDRFRIPIDWIFIIYASVALERIFSFGKKPLINTSTGDEHFFDTEGEMTTAFKKWGKRAGALAGAGIIMVYLVMVLPQYFKAEAPFDGYSIDIAKVESVLKDTGYYEQWLKQDKAIYTVQELIEKRIRESSPDKDYEPWIVAWTGEMSYISRKGLQPFHRFLLSVNAHGRNIGDGRFRCYVEQNAVIEKSNPKEGEVAIIIGYTKGNALGAPRIQVLGVSPYPEQKQ